VVKDPLARDDVGVPRRRHEIPSVVAKESTILPVIASSQLGSLSAARAEEGTGEYLLTETCRLSRSQGGTWMPEVLRVRCMGTRDGACVGEGSREGAGEGGGEGVGEGGPVGLCGATGGTTIEGTSSRNS
jgi:hypothetical protein